jgi:ABC-type branched-subunit amino acid transport system ATPase component
VSALLVVEGLSKSYRGVRALDDVGFTVDSNRIVGVIGPNGSGKSTMIDCISRFQEADRGTVTLAERPITGLAPHEIARAGLIRTFQTVRVFEHLTVMETLLNAMVPFDQANWLDAILRTRRLRSGIQCARAR